MLPLRSSVPAPCVSCVFRRLSFDGGFCAVVQTEIDGLVWGEAHKLVPVAFGVKKLVLSCVVEDDKVRFLPGFCWVDRNTSTRCCVFLFFQSLPVPRPTAVDRRPRVQRFWCATETLTLAGPAPSLESQKPFCCCCCDIMSFVLFRGVLAGLVWWNATATPTMCVPFGCAFVHHSPCSHFYYLASIHS